MATWAQNLQTAINNATATLADVTANPRPTYDVQGDTVKWAEYVEMLTSNIERWTILIARGEPFEVVGGAQ
jgi:hypothetical protein